ncbi:hypothetical protein Tsp_03158 [Trichinella spiralis]|uniref:hypothetical protein n=1 Tax=Trichinella spiralis TaxID=6334 RepID=UPI0001EFBDD0|nr:hypothetical protein Tsp_03158 [Trichinella spiralis]
MPGLGVERGKLYLQYIRRCASMFKCDAAFTSSSTFSNCSSAFIVCIQIVLAFSSLHFFPIYSQNMRQK